MRIILLIALMYYLYQASYKDKFLNIDQYYDQKCCKNKNNNLKY